VIRETRTNHSRQKQKWPGNTVGTTVNKKSVPETNPTNTASRYSNSSGRDRFKKMYLRKDSAYSKFKASETLDNKLVS
jgi:hypothetical protein